MNSLSILDPIELNGFSYVLPVHYFLAERLTSNRLKICTNLLNNQNYKTNWYTRKEINFWLSSSCLSMWDDPFLHVLLNLLTRQHAWISTAVKILAANQKLWFQGVLKLTLHTADQTMRKGTRKGNFWGKTWKIVKM